MNQSKWTAGRAGAAIVAIGLTLALLPAIVPGRHLASVRADDEQGYQNPIYRHNAPDPVMTQASDGRFYTYTTQSTYDGKKVRIPVLASENLVDWEFVGDALPVRPPWALRGPRSDFWAPEIVRDDDRYLLYYSARHAGTKSMAIGVAVSDVPTGPFVDAGRPLKKGPGFTTIDPFVFRTATGDSFLYWGSDGKPIKAQPLSRDGMRLTGDPTVVLHPDESLDYESLIEGPWIIEHDGYFYLMYSGDRCCYSTAHYAVMVARSTDPLGSFERHGNNPILEQNASFRAPGHNSTFTDAAGDQWILYHAMLKSEKSLDRYLMLDRIEWDDDGWPMINDGNGPSLSSEVRPAPTPPELLEV